MKLFSIQLLHGEMGKLSTCLKHIAQNKQKTLEKDIQDKLMF